MEKASSKMSLCCLHLGEGDFAPTWRSVRKVTSKTSIFRQTFSPHRWSAGSAFYRILPDAPQGNGEEEEDLVCNVVEADDIAVSNFVDQRDFSDSEVSYEVDTFPEGLQNHEKLDNPAQEQEQKIMENLEIEIRMCPWQKISLFLLVLVCFLFVFLYNIEQVSNLFNNMLSSVITFWIGFLKEEKEEVVNYPTFGERLRMVMTSKIFLSKRDTILSVSSVLLIIFAFLP